MPKKLILILIIFTVSLSEEAAKVFAQQIGMYSHYFYNPMLYNPSFAGSGEYSNAMLLQRNQWTDFRGAPRLSIFTIDGSLSAEKIGLGFSLLNDRKGITNRTSGNLAYSYRINLNSDMHLLLGLSLGVIYQSLDFSKTFIENPTDPNLFTDAQQKTGLDANAGFAFVYKGLELSAALPQLMQNKINYVDYSNVRGYYALTRHYMISAKYKLLISPEKEISLAPQAFIRFVPNTPFQFDGVVTLDWKDKLWAGVTYKSNYAVSANVGFHIHQKLSLGYSYDIIIGSIGNYSGTSHELMINYKFAGNNNSKKDTLPTTAPNNEYEVLINDLQAQVDETEQQITELEERIGTGTNSNTPEKNLTLTDLVVQQLINKIEEMFDIENAPTEQIQSLRNEIAAFLDSEFANEQTQKNLKKQYEKLNKIQDVTSVLVKGTVKLQKSDEKINYSDVIITINDTETGNLIGSYIPNAKTGKYIFILTPGRSYNITAELQGYQTYTEDFAPAQSNQSYELSHEIRLLPK